MERKKIIHRDLKPENILLNSSSKGVYDIRIADFGFAVLVKGDESDESNLNCLCGTPGYIDPEVLQERSFSFKSDIFSVGSIIFSLLTRRNLFSGKSESSVLKKNRDCNLDCVPLYMKRCS